LISLPGQSPTVSAGITKVIRDEFPQVISNYIVFGNNPLLTRAAIDAGAVDVWIQGQTSTTLTAAIPYLGVGQKHILPSQPVISISSIQAVGNSSQYVQGIDYTFVPDTGTYSGSVQGQDAFVFLPGGAGATLAQGTTLTVVYNQNALMEELQTAFNTDADLTFGRNLLFRQGEDEATTLVANVSVLSGYDVNTTLAQLSSTLATYVNTLQLGQNVEGFELDLQAGTIPAISNFVLTTLALVGGTGNSDILISANQYPTLNPINIALTSV
jgi:hypothetical protein